MWGRPVCDTIFLPAGTQREKLTYGGIAMQRSVDDIRKDFPILARTVHGKPLVYLDNAATTQLPKRVIDRWVEHYTSGNGNVHRGVHYLAEQSTLGMERARDHAKRFLHGESTGEIIFTSGATDSANLVAASFLRHRLEPGDVVLSTELEHHANFVTWQQLCLECNAEFRVIPAVDGELDMNMAKQLLRGPVKLLAVTLVSNVTGTVVDVDTLAGLAHESGIPIYVDAAQGLRHVSVNLAAQPWDFVGFSAHKLMGPTGVGCLFVRDKWLNEMAPYRYGGGMIDRVSEMLTTFADLPGRLEAGTPNYSGIIAFDEALSYLEELGLAGIAAYEEGLLCYTEELLRKMRGVHILGHPKQRAGAISIAVDGAHPYDIANMLDQCGVAVRSGSMCAQPIVHKMGTDTVIRISPAFYNTRKEIAYMAEQLEKVIALLRRYSN